MSYLRDAYFFDLKVKILNKTGTRFKLLNNTHVSGNDPFPLVKDIVGYLKMCHSILPIKR